ncbi:unnamed protein product, partial [Porites evermanni]
MNNSASAAIKLQNQQENQGLRQMIKALPIAIVIIVTNGLVFFLFYRRKSLRIKSNYLLLGLAVCDFLTGAVNIPYFIIFCFNVVPSQMFDQFAFWMYALHTLTAVSAAYHILVITAEKFLAIAQPLRHHIVTKKAAVFKVLAGIWFISAFIAIIPLSWRNAKSKSLALIIHSSFCLALVFLVPYVFMVYAYTVMFKVVTGRKRPSQHGHKQRLQKKNKTDRKCIFVFALMAATYLCCWLPYFTLMLIINIKIYSKSNDLVAIEKATNAFAVIRYITSATNPLLYTFFKRDFWIALHVTSVRRNSIFSENSTPRGSKE